MGGLTCAGRQICPPNRGTDPLPGSAVEHLTAAGVPAAPVADVADVVAAPQTEALGILQELPHPSIPDLRLPALPMSFDHGRLLHRSPPPAVGQHTAEILAEAGYDDETIAALAARGVITA